MAEVSEPREEYKQQLPVWQMIEDIRGGTRAMRAAGTTYLPQQAAEAWENYQRRLKTSVFSNFYSKIARRIVGKLLEQPPSAEEGTPDNIRDLLESIDACGNRLDVFARDWLSAAIDDGVAHVLVDSPTIDAEDATLADAQSIRPYCRIVRAKDLLNWESVNEDGQERLTRIHVREEVEVPGEEDFEVITVERIRVIEPGRVTVWEKDWNGEWSILMEQETDFTEIPLVTLYTRKEEFMVGTPLMLDVAYLNVKHWQAQSDHHAMVNFLRVPILHAKGFDDGAGGEFQLVIGNNSYIKSGPGSELEWVELTGKNVEMSRDELQDVENTIRKLGSEVLLGQGTGQTTATARALDQAEADIDCAAIANDLEDALNNVLDWLGFWTNTEEPGSVTTFKDFKALSLDDTSNQQLLDMYMAEALSLPTLLEEVQRRGLIAADRNVGEEIALIETEGIGNVLRRPPRPEDDIDDDAA